MKRSVVWSVPAARGSAGQEGRLQVEEEDPEYPLWGRILIAATVLGLGAVAGGLVAGGWMGALWGTIVAAPVALLGFAAPAVLGWIMVVIEVFSCAS
jgi:hypothetical protein